MDLHRATDAEKAVEPEVRQLVFGSAPPRPGKIRRRPKFYTSATAEEFPKLVEYVRDQITSRFDLHGSVPDSTAWWIVERVLHRAPDCPTATSSIEERRLIAAKHLMALGNDYSDEFTVLGRNGRAKYSIGALRSVSQSAPRQQKGVPDGGNSYEGPFEKTKTLRMNLAACIVADSTDQSTLAWEKPATREIALTVTILLTQFVNNAITREELDAFLRDESAHALSSPTTAVSVDNQSILPTADPESAAVTVAADTDYILLADLVVPARITYDAHPELFKDLEVFVEGDEAAARLIAAGLHLPGSPPFADTLRALTNGSNGTEGVDHLLASERAQAAARWLISLLRDDERLALLAFARLPEGFTASLELLTGEEHLGHSLAALSRLSAVMNLVEEPSPERYRLRRDLHHAIETVAQQAQSDESTSDALAAVVDYYEPRLWSVTRTFELDYLASSGTLRVAAGYAPDSLPPMTMTVATDWWEAEQDNIFQLHAVLFAYFRTRNSTREREPGHRNIDAFSLLWRIEQPMTRATRVLRSTSPTNLVAEINAAHIELHYLNMRADKILHEHDEHKKRAIRELREELAKNPEPERAEYIRDVISRLDIDE